MRSWIAVALGLCLWIPLLRAEETLDGALHNDVVLRALVDELARGISGLKLEDLERPYFLEYGLSDAQSAWVTAELGAITGCSEGRARALRADVRVGSYALDNTNFGGRYSDYGGAMDGAQIPIEDDYNAIRQGIWWSTDRAYKSVVEAFVQKKAFMEGKIIEDKPPDFSHETPIVYIEDRSSVNLDRTWLEQVAVKLSGVFREFPEIQESGVSVKAVAGDKYLVNTEGTRLRSPGARYSLSVTATIQADDGMKLSDALEFDVRKPEQLPSMDELVQHCRQMAARLIAVKNAPRFDEAYAGPVLFEPEAAAELFLVQFGQRFAGGQRPVGSRTNPDDFVNKLNRRILPRFMDVVDDPTVETISGRPSLGHYRFDDQGVKAQRVHLVENGRLKALLMSRNPSKEFPNSNGHGRGLYGPRASVGALVVTATPAATPGELRQELLEVCQDEGLEFGLRVAALGGRAGSPLVVYKVYPGGREELVRGAEIARFDLKAFKRILAAGDQAHVLNVSGRAELVTAAVPALLFEELDVGKIDRDFDKPPILPAPIAR